MGIIYRCPFGSIYAGMGELRDQNRFLVRMPEGMRDRIADAAKSNGRSMNSEIVAALEEKFPISDPIGEATSLLRSMSPADRRRAVDALRKIADY